jgi:hypothetical protein
VQVPYITAIRRARGQRRLHGRDRLCSLRRRLAGAIIGGGSRVNLEDGRCFCHTARRSPSASYRHRCREWTCQSIRAPCWSRVQPGRHEETHSHVQRRMEDETQSCQSALCQTRSAYARVSAWSHLPKTRLAFVDMGNFHQRAEQQP